MHYQQKIDKIFGKGSMWKHRALRTILDPFSSEFGQTTMEEKVAILKKILKNDLDLTELIQEYKEFYLEE